MLQAAFALGPANGRQDGGGGPAFWLVPSPRFSSHLLSLCAKSPLFDASGGRAAVCLKSPPFKGMQPQNQRSLKSTLPLPAWGRPSLIRALSPAEGVLSLPRLWCCPAHGREDPNLSSQPPEAQLLGQPPPGPTPGVPWLRGSFKLAATLGFRDCASPLPPCPLSVLIEPFTLKGQQWDTARATRSLQVV